MLLAHQDLAYFGLEVRKLGLKPSNLMIQPVTTHRTHAFATLKLPAQPTSPQFLFPNRSNFHSMARDSRLSRPVGQISTN